MKDKYISTEERLRLLVGKPMPPGVTGVTTMCVEMCNFFPPQCTGVLVFVLNGTGIVTETGSIWHSATYHIFHQPPLLLEELSCGPVTLVAPSVL